jgi:hypothetical protein
MSVDHPGPAVVKDHRALDPSPELRSRDSPVGLWSGRPAAIRAPLTSCMEELAEPGRRSRGADGCFPYSIIECGNALTCPGLAGRIYAAHHLQLSLCAEASKLAGTSTGGHSGKEESETHDDEACSARS